MNLGKTKGEEKFTVVRKKIDKVNFGQIFSLETGRQSAECKRRVKQVWAAFGRLNFEMKSNNVPMRHKREILISALACNEL